MISSKDFAVAFNALRTHRGYAATIIATLGFTLGALVAMFDLNYQLLAAPLPYPEQERLYISEGNAYNAGKVQFANEVPYPGLIEAYKRREEDFERAALISFGFDIVQDRPDSPRVTTSYSTPEYFELVGAPMALGRAFSEAEGLDARTPVTVISYPAWQMLFNGDRGALGKTLRFRGTDFRIIGVTAEDFTEPQLAGIGRLTEVWLPWDYNNAFERARSSWTRTDGAQHLVGRLKAGGDAARVQQALTSLLNGRFKSETASQPFFNDMTLDFKLVPFRQAILGDSRSVVLLLFAGALVLLLIAAANVTNLTLARAAGQQKNMAIQAALGAQKKHLFLAVFAEILLLLGLAAALSLAVASGGIALLKLLAQKYLPRLAELHLNWPSFGFAVLAALTLASVFALLISHQINYRALHDTLKSSGKGTGIQLSVNVRRGLILSQVALTGVLLAASLQVLTQSIQRIAQPLGFQTADVYYVALNMGGQRDAPPEHLRNELLAIRSELQSDPKVVDASIASGTPIHFGGDAQYQSLLSREPDFQQQQEAATTLVDENFAPILGLVMTDGQQFQPGDVQNGTKSLLVNETFARNWQADGAVLDKLLYWRNSPDRGQTPYRVTGIVRDFTLPGRAEMPRVFVPQIRPVDPVLVLKMKSGQEFTNTELNQVIGRINNEYKVAMLLSLSRAHSLLIARDSLAAGFTAVLVTLAISLAAIGIYGVLSYTVLIRRVELGVRMAIGARPVTVFMQILKDNLVAVIAGLVVALGVLSALWRWAQGHGYIVQASLLNWTLLVVLIIGLTAAATLLSVWRVISKPVYHALRNE